MSLSQRSAEFSSGLTGVGVMALSLLALPAQAQSVERGQALYQSNCVACHSVEANRIGPMHQGVLNRKVGSVAGFEYSSALRNSKLTWTRANLLAWLKNPEDLIPGQAMDFSLAEARDREDVVAYLATLTAPAQPGK